MSNLDTLNNIPEKIENKNKEQIIKENHIAWKLLREQLFTLLDPKREIPKDWYTFSVDPSKSWTSFEYKWTNYNISASNNYWFDKDLNPNSDVDILFSIRVQKEWEDYNNPISINIHEYHWIRVNWEKINIEDYEKTLNIINNVLNKYSIYKGEQNKIDEIIDNKIDEIALENNFNESEVNFLSLLYTEKKWDKSWLNPRHMQYMDIMKEKYWSNIFDNIENKINNI